MNTVSSSGLLVLSSQGSHSLRYSRLASTTANISSATSGMV